MPRQETQETQVRYLGQEDPLEKEMATPPQYFCLENAMDRGAWQATVHRVTQSWTWLSTHACMYTFCNVVSLRLGGMYTDVRFCFLKMPETCLKKIIRPILGSINLHPKNRILKISILHKMFKTGSHNPANESCTS